MIYNLVKPIHHESRSALSFSCHSEPPDHVHITRVSYRTRKPVTGVDPSKWMVFTGIMATHHPLHQIHIFCNVSHIHMCMYSIWTWYVSSHWLPPKIWCLNERADNISGSCKPVFAGDASLKYLKIQLWLFKLTMLVDPPHFCHLNSLFSHQKRCEPPSLRRILRKWPRTSQHSCPQWMKISGAKGWREHHAAMGCPVWVCPKGGIPMIASKKAQISCHSFSMYRIYFSIFFGLAI